ncbi:hypothetical protein CAMRE0001_0384 [Campylobacter rectus RM3267]|uniref:Uncharacterized protein n=1 Tax=Campylobacter rectus RM3267 TaxID=553218 RepID=B9D2F4_CAMRE|nr:hypothetical protein CAMRE0001_0384 [Campylobacter rectus RM3267]
MSKFCRKFRIFVILSNLRMPVEPTFPNAKTHLVIFASKNELGSGLRDNGRALPTLQTRRFHLGAKLINKLNFVRLNLKSSLSG